MNSASTPFIKSYYKIPESAGRPKEVNIHDNKKVRFLVLHKEDTDSMASEERMTAFTAIMDRLGILPGEFRFINLARESFDPAVLTDLRPAYLLILGERARQIAGLHLDVKLYLPFRFHQSHCLMANSWEWINKEEARKKAFWQAMQQLIPTH